MSKTLVLERRYRARPEQVFAAWSDIDKVRRWFGCGPGVLWTIHSWDCRVGGALSVSLQSGERLIEVDGTFTEVSPPHRLAYRWGADEHVEVLIEATADGSLLTLTHRGLQDAADQQLREGGWSHCLESLATITNTFVA